MTTTLDESIARFLTESLEHLTAHEFLKSELASSGRHLEIFPADNNQFMIHTGMSRKIKGNFYRIGNPNIRSTSTVNLLSRELITYFDQRKGYTHKSNKELHEHLDMQKSNIDSNIVLLLKTGLWGRVLGRGNGRTRYYPLFTEIGMQEYLKCIELAKAGVYPLGSKKKATNVIRPDLSRFEDTAPEAHDPDVNQEPTQNDFDSAVFSEDTYDPDVFPEEPHDPEATPPDPHETSDSASYGPLL